MVPFMRDYPMVCVEGCIYEDELDPEVETL